MIKPGTDLTLQYGTSIQIDALLGAGGEGAVYHARNRKSSVPGVFKILKNRTSEKVRRTKFLADLRLNEMSELFCAPTDFIDNGHLGHFSPFAPGVLLGQHLETPGNQYPETMKLAIAFCHAHARLNELHLGQGDVGLTNAMVHVTPAGPEFRLIDFDNYFAVNLPPPTSFGQEERMAPELRKAWKSGHWVTPDELSDRYAIATVVHDMLLAKSVAAGFDLTPEMFDQAMTGGWPHDPVYGRSPADSGGYPSTILNVELAGMFRRGFSVKREDRPSAVAWTKVLSENFLQIWVDPACQGPSFLDFSKTHCPHCGRRFPSLKLEFTALNKTIVCDSASVSIGRTDLLSPKVSSLHAIIRKFGPETRLQPLGQNGTFRGNGNSWKRLETEAIIQKGDQLRFADVSCVVEEVVLA